MSQRIPLKKALRRVFMRLHIALYRISNGWLGAHLGRRSFLLLTTLGWKSGQERVTPILYIAHEGDFILVASNWGQPFLPAWARNLQAHPQARIRAGRKNIAVLAHQASSEERAHLWPPIARRYGEFARYQRHSTREIPLIILHPTLSNDAHALQLSGS